MLRLTNRTKRCRIPVSLFFILSLVSFSPSKETNGTPEPKLAENLKIALEKATKKKLFYHHYWLSLLHYEKTIFGFRSQIDDPKFFLSPNGKSDPEEELIATLTSYYDGKDNSDSISPTCRFLARYHWLKRKLELPEHQFPPEDCENFNKLLDHFVPQKVILAFPTAYMNNPASMFGHTLLNLQGSDGSSLLSKSVNYSARTAETSGIIFAFKGIFGFYPGYYEILPYYARIQLYNDINERDIWEYELNLNEEEILGMVRHLWELQEVYSKYYFFDENCAYNLLRLIDVARPSLKLSDQFKGYVIPIDTIRSLVDFGVVSKVTYRPSKATKIKHLSGLLSQHSRKLARMMATREEDPESIFGYQLDDEQIVNIVDLAVEFLQHRYFNKEIDQASYRSLFLQLLRIRSKMEAPEAIEIPIKSPQQPEKGHRSKRISIGLEVDSGRLFQSLKFRPAYHDLLDPEPGYLTGSEIEFFDLKIRYDPTDNRLELNNLDLISIQATSPRDLFFKPISWRLQLGVNDKLFDKAERHHVGTLSTGQGLSWKLAKRGTFHTLAEFSSLVGKNLQPAYAVGVGASIGYLYNVNSRWKIHGLSKGTRFFAGDTHTAFEFSLAQGVTISQNLSLRMSIKRERSFNTYSTVSNAELHLFF